MVTLSVLHPGENSDTATMGQTPVGYWTGADAFCLDVQGAELKDVTYKLENQSQYDSINGAVICVNSGYGDRVNIGKTLKEGRTIKIYYKKYR
ncbi:hypothetical protein SAMN05216516_102188 [Izhakiella capsodis]|uniref:Uncharacterized protein n=1 Tax=Izhakiella capsodis TaxID=1367852 RepID=A0A1I4VZU4_9GAMM|nr:hypothetical protein SAMN05216516_102188 [Izhakiella capsodis]